MKVFALCAPLLLAAQAMAQPTKPPPFTQKQPAQSALFKKMVATVAVRKVALTPFLTSRNQWALRQPFDVDRYRLQMVLRPSSDEATILVTLQLKQLRDPAKVSKDNLVRMLVQNREFGAAHFSFDLDGKRFEINQVIPASNLTNAAIDEAFRRISAMAKSTASMWDDALWK